MENWLTDLFEWHGLVIFICCTASRQSSARGRSWLRFRLTNDDCKFNTSLWEHHSQMSQWDAGVWHSNLIMSTSHLTQTSASPSTRGFNALNQNTFLSGKIQLYDSVWHYEIFHASSAQALSQFSLVNSDMLDVLHGEQIKTILVFKPTETLKFVCKFKTQLCFTYCIFSWRNLFLFHLFLFLHWWC